MKKDVKVIVIKAKAYNGHDRTVQAIVPLEMEASDVIVVKHIPMPSIISISITPPMTVNEAIVYVSNAYIAITTNPNLSFLKSNFTVYAA